MALQGLLALADRRDLVLKVRYGVPSAAGFVRIGLVHLFEVAFQPVVDALQVPLQCGSREVAVTVVHRLDARAIHSDQLAPVQGKFSAQPHERPKDLPEGAPVVAAEVGDRLEVGAKLAQQPDHLQVAVRLDLQAPAGPNTVEIPVDVELQQIRRIVARAALVVGPNALEPRLLEIEAIDEGINETDRVVPAPHSHPQRRGEAAAGNGLHRICVPCRILPNAVVTPPLADRPQALLSTTFHTVWAVCDTRARAPSDVRRSVSYPVSDSMSCRRSNE